MKVKKSFKKVLALICAIALTVTGMTGIDKFSVTTKADTLSDIVLDDSDSPAIKDSTWNGAYQYLGFATFKNFSEYNNDNKQDYKYLTITYTGSAEFLRLEFVHNAGQSDEEKSDQFWLNPYQRKHLVTTKGNDIDFESVKTEPTTVVIDLAATEEANGSKIFDFYNDGMHMHNGDAALPETDRHTNITDARFTTTDLTAVKPAPEFKQEKELTAFEAEWDTASEDPAYKYLAYVGCDTSSDFKYMQITYKGDAEALSNARLEFKSPDDKTIGNNHWFSDNADGTLLTYDGKQIPVATEEEQTAIIDLEASGVDTSEGLGAFHVHSASNKGKFTIISAKMLSTQEPPETPTTGTEETTTVTPVDPATGIKLDGDTQGKSAMNGTFEIKFKEGGDDVQYKYLGYVTFKDLATKDFKYLKFTYTGDITGLRLEFNQNPGNECDPSGPIWFDPMQERHLVTEDNTPIQMFGDNTTVVIDLQKSGIDMSKYNSGFHMHGETANAKDFSVTIKDAVLYGGVPTERPTVAPTTAKPTTVAPTKKTAKPTKPTIKKATKKKSATKMSITLKKVSKAKGYQIKIGTNKKITKGVKTVTSKSVKVTIKKLKKNKQYYVKARAYKVDSKKKKVYGKWSKVKKIKMTK